MTDRVEERLNRYVARRTGLSRRAADALIAAGRVTIEGRAQEVGVKVGKSDRVFVDGQPLAPPPASRTVMLNKPRGVVSTRRDPEGRPTVMGFSTDPGNLVPVGRLDADSRGLLLLSSDGDLVARLTHPRHGVKKTYRVRCSRRPTAADLVRLRAGARLDDGPARPLAVWKATDGAIDIVMGEGRRREVRRLCAAVGLDVVDLQRVAFGPLTLGALPEGTVRDLQQSESADLYRAAGLDPESSGLKA